MPAATAARKPPAASTLLQHVPGALGELLGEPLHVPRSAGCVDHGRGVRLQRQHRLRVARESAAELAGALESVVGQHGDGVGTAHRRGEAGDRRPDDVDGGVVARRHRTGGHRVQRDATGGIRGAGDIGDACEQAPRGADLGDRGELVDGGCESQLELRERGHDVDAAVGEGAQCRDGRRDGVAELLGIGGTAIVEAGAVDRRDADVGVLGGEQSRLGGERVKVGVEVFAVAFGEPAAERVGSERSGDAPGVGAARCPQPGQSGRRGQPAAAGVEHDGGDVEEHAVEQLAERPLVGLSSTAEAKPHRGGPAFQLGDGGTAALRRVDDLADVPSATGGGGGAAAYERGEAREADVRDLAGCRVERVDHHAVVRRRTSRSTSPASASQSSSEASGKSAASASGASTSATAAAYGPARCGLSPC